MPAPVIALTPLFDEESHAEQLVDLAHRYGRYELYSEHEKIEIDLGRGLSQRHDSVQHFLRTGGARGGEAPLAALAARTSYFREEYAYSADERIAGIGPFLHHRTLRDAAVAVHGRPVVEPAIAYANLMLPGQELAVHTDVPEFRGANRKVLPQWLLVVMHHAGLFAPWRLHIATGIAWFQTTAEGGLRYWPEGPEQPSVRHELVANTALVLDTDSVFHGVDPVDPGREPPPLRPGTALVATGERTWALLGPDGAELERFRWDELRYSVSWKAYCFADEAERTAWRDHTDDLTLDHVIETLVADLVERGRVAPGPAIDRQLGLEMIDEYVRYPGTVPDTAS